MSRTLDEADRRLGEAVEAVRSIDRGELPDELQDDIREAVFAVLAAKGAAEVERTEVSGE